jgi:hypothetical protein
LHLYVVGLGKTGTTSLAAVFGAYRSGHEVDATRMKRVAARARAGELEPDRARAELRRRDRRFRLEVDSAHFLTPFVPQLAELYPRARFVVLIRDCFSWVDSVLEQWARIAVRQPDSLRQRLELTGVSDVPDIVKSWMLVEQQLRSGRATAALSASLLRTWATTNTRLLAAVPDGRALVLRTDDIDTAGARLAEFCQVDPSTLRSGERRNVAPFRAGVVGAVPAEVASREADRWCAPLMERYWGSEWRGFVDRMSSRVQSSHDATP